MAGGDQWTHLLLQSGLLDDLQSPLRGSARLKFTSLSVSVRYIALGSNTGNVYIFDRNTLKHLQVVFPEVEPSSVNVVALCPNEKLVAFSTLNGHVVVMDMNIDKRVRPERLKLITEHVRTTVTCIQWEHSGGKIYVSDVMGKVSMSVVPKVKNLVEMNVDVIMQLESSVIQMDWSDDKLLVSTVTRTYLCSTIRQQYSQVGKKPREGEYGGCFYKLNRTSLPLIYCARPSSRVWEVDYDGNVLSTHQFKQLLATPPIGVINMTDKAWSSEEKSEWSGQGINFPRLKMIGSQYLVSWRNNRLYILNPMKVKVILWDEIETGIQELCPVKSDMYLFLTSGEVRKIQMFSVAQVISILHRKRNMSLAADLCCNFQEVLLKGKWRKHLSIPRLQEVGQQIHGTELEENYETFLSHLLKLDSVDESDDDSSESYRSRSSSSASIQSYNKILTAASKSSTQEVTVSNCVTMVTDNENPRQEVTAEVTASECVPTREVTASECVPIQEVTVSEYVPMVTAIQEVVTSECVTMVTAIQEVVASECVAIVTPTQEVFASECVTMVTGTNVANNEIESEELQSNCSENGVILIPMEENQQVADGASDECYSDSGIVHQDLSVENLTDEQDPWSRSTRSPISPSTESRLTEHLDIPDGVGNSDLGRRNDTTNDSPHEEVAMRSHVIDSNHGDFVENSQIDDEAGNDELYSLDGVRSTETGTPTVVRQEDEDLVPVLAVVPSTEGLNSPEKVKRKKKINTVNLGTPRKGEKSKQKGPRKSAGMRHTSNATETEAGFKSTGSLKMPATLDIYNDDIFANENEIVLMNVNETKMGKLEQSINDVECTKSGSDVRPSSKNETTAHDPAVETSTEVSDSVSQMPRNEALTSDVDPVSKTSAVHVLDSVSRSLQKDETMYGRSELSNEELDSMPQLSQSNKPTPDLEPASTASDVLDSDSEPSQKNETIIDQEIATEHSNEESDAMPHSSQSDDLTSDLERASKASTWLSDNAVQDRSSVSGGMVKVRSESDITASFLSANRRQDRYISRRHSEFTTSLDGKPMEFASSVNKKQAEFTWSLERKQADFTSSLDSSSLGSSPSQSPLSQSWEGSVPDSLISSSPKMSLSSMKDSLQTKFTVTKRMLLKTIKEKNLLSKSPSREELTILDPQLQAKQTFNSITENNLEVEKVPEKLSVDLSDLRDKTESTMKVLQDISVVMNPIVVKDVLTQWVEQLNRTLHALHIELYNENVRQAKRGSFVMGNQQNLPLGVSATSDVRMKDSACRKGTRNSEHTGEVVLSETDRWSETLSSVGTGHLIGQSVDSTKLRGQSNQTEGQSDKVKGHLEDTKGVNKDELSWSSVDLDSGVFHEDLAAQVSDGIRGDDPFNMPEDLYHDVAHLAQTCFAAGCYGNVSMYVKPAAVQDSNMATERVTVVSKFDGQTGDIEWKIDDDSSTHLFDQYEQNSIPCKIPQHSEPDGQRLCDKVDDQYRSRCPVKGTRDQADQRSSSSTSDDTDVCTFMQCYCFLLDMGRVREHMTSYHGNLFRFWCTYVKCVQEVYKKDVFFVKLMNHEVHYAVDILKMGNYAAEKFLACITKLFEQSCGLALEMYEDSPHVEPLDVYFMCLYYSHPVSLYISYMYAKVKDTMSSNRQADAMYGHSFIRLKWLEMLLVENRPVTMVTKDDNSPRPGSHLAEWKNAEFIHHVLNSTTDETEMAEFLELTQSSGFWFGCLRLLQRLERRRDVLMLVLQLGDINLFGTEENYLPQMREEWIFVSQTLHKQCESSGPTMPDGDSIFKRCMERSTGKERNENSQILSDEKSSGNISTSDEFDKRHLKLNDKQLSCDGMKKHQENNIPSGKRRDRDSDRSWDRNTYSISWDDFATLMLSHLGPVATVTILQECDIPDDGISPNFHQSAVVSMLLDRNKRNVTHNLLEKVDSYLWAKKPLTLMPELRYSVMQEKRAKSSPQSDHQKDRYSLLPFVSEASLPCVRYSEDMDSHWGTSVKMTRNCLCCSLSLMESVSHVEPGVLLFQCGHVYHKLCVPARLCPICGLHSSQQPVSHV